MSNINDTSWLQDLFIDEAKPALDRHSGGSGGGSSAPADWNAKEGETGHILNRTHWEEAGELIEILPETKVVLANGQGFIEPEDDAPNLVDGIEYHITWNGIEYVSYGFDAGDGYAYVGDIYTASRGEIGVESTGEPFVIGCDARGYMVMSLDNSAEVTVAITGKNAIVHKIATKYLPELSDSSDYGTKGIVNKGTILNTIRKEGINLKVGVTTYYEMSEIRDRHAIYSVLLNGNHYTGLYMYAYGQYGVSQTCKIIALDDSGKGCLIEMMFDWSENDVAAKSIEVVYPE
jgi:hypothetical protein